MNNEAQEKTPIASFASAHTTSSPHRGADNRGSSLSKAEAPAPDSPQLRCRDSGLGSGERERVDTNQNKLYRGRYCGKLDVNLKNRSSGEWVVR